MPGLHMPDRVRNKRFLLLAVAIISPFSVTARDAIHVEDLAPNFSLYDQNGVKQSLNSLYGPKGLLLVFHRSADW